jgi:hypothetical protein
VSLLGYKESLHVESPPLGESQTSKSGGTEGRPTKTVAMSLEEKALSAVSSAATMA